jgi:hypothetical protein
VILLGEIPAATLAPPPPPHPSPSPGGIGAQFLYGFGDFTSSQASSVRIQERRFTMGRGPVPKDPRDRARRNAPPIPYRYIRSPASPQPPLPPSMPDGSDWPEQTRQWWRMWRDDSRSASFRPTDWAMLMDTAVLHGLYWRGDTKVAAELRLRVAKLGSRKGC